MLNSYDSDSYYNCGLCYNLKRQTDKVKKDFQRVYELGDKDLNNGGFDASGSKVNGVRHWEEAAVYAASEAFP